MLSEGCKFEKKIQLLQFY